MKNSYGVSIKWLAVTSFEIPCNGLTVVTDPYITECAGTDLTWEAVENCDILCLGHAHWDHVTDIPRLVKKFRPKLLCGEQTAMPLAKWLNYTPTRIYPMYPGTELDFGPVSIRAFYGRHTNLGSGYNDQVKLLASREWSQENPDSMEVQAWGSLEYRNYLFTFQNGTKLLIWGNDPTVEQKNMLAPMKPDIAILQLSKQDPVEMAEFAEAIGAKVVIPHHMDLRKTPEMYMPKVLKMQEEFLKRGPDGTFICPKNGEWMHL